MATAGSGNKKKTKFEYKPDIYDEENKFTEQEYWESIANKDKDDVILRDFDLRPFASELYNQQLP